MKILSCCQVNFCKNECFLISGCSTFKKWSSQLLPYSRKTCSPHCLLSSFSTRTKSWRSSKKTKSSSPNSSTSWPTKTLRRAGGRNWSCSSRSSSPSPPPCSPKLGSPSSKRSTTWECCKPWRSPWPRRTRWPNQPPSTSSATPSTSRPPWCASTCSSSCPAPRMTHFWWTLS